MFIRSFALRVELRLWRSSPRLRHPFMVFLPPFFSLALSCLRGFESHGSFSIDHVHRVLARSPSCRMLPSSDVGSSLELRAGLGLPCVSFTRASRSSHPLSLLVPLLCTQPEAGSGLWLHRSSPGVCSDRDSLPPPVSLVTGHASLLGVDPSE